VNVANLKRGAVWGCTMAGVRLTQLAARTSSRWFPDVLRHSITYGAKQVQDYVYLTLPALFRRQNSEFHLK
jgi:hypothetical protein